MKVIIVEDEKFARENLINHITDLEPGIQIMDTFDSVEDTADFLSKNQPDLIFLDIHLADGLSFSIFDEVEVKSPIIFTTAYDQYAIKAFKVNSIDYLLKPIDKQELREALQKYHRIAAPKIQAVEELKMALLSPETKEYQKRFMVKKGEKLFSIKTEDVAYFEGEDRYTYLVNHSDNKYFVDYKLAELEEMLDPNQFFRLNRSFIANYDTIKDVIVMSKSRVKVTLNPSPKRDIVVSTDNTRLFKAWLNR